MNKRSIVHSAAAASILAIAGVLGVATPAQAHDYLVSSTPAADSTVTELPAAFSVTMNEPMLDLAGNGSGFAIQVVDAAGAFYGDGCIAIADATLSMGATLGEAGAYTLKWQVVSADGHPVSGELGFTWAPPAGAEASLGSAAPPVCGGPTPTATPSAEPSESATTEPAEPEHENANLGDVLWVGGAIAAVLLAGLVALLIVSRRRKG